MLNLPPLWHMTYTGPISVHVVNFAELSEATGYGSAVLRTIQVMKHADRAEMIEAGEVVAEVVPGLVPQTVAVFRVVKWHPQAILLVLEFRGVATALLGGNLCYL